MRKKRYVITWTPEERAEWLRLLEESGKPLSEFCRANGLPESTVSLWRKHQREPGARAADDGEFIEVTLPPAPVAAPAVSSITIRVGSEVAIEIPAGTEPAWLAELVRRLRTES